MSMLYSKFTIGSKLVVQNMKESEFIYASYSQVVARWMESKGKQRLVALKLLF